MSTNATTPARRTPGEGQNLDKLYRNCTPPGRSTSSEKYRAFLADAPGPKSGRGNPWLFDAALRAKGAGLSAHEAQADIQAAMPHKPAGEVARAVRNAYRLGNDWTPPTAPRTPAKPKAEGTQFRQRCTRKYPESMDPVELLWEKSPYHIDWPPEEDAARVMDALYTPDEFIFMGERYDKNTVRTVADWQAYIARGGVLAPHWIPNPLSGQHGPTADGSGTTMRGDSCVAAWRFVVCEFDHISHAEQAAFWLEAKLPLAVVVDSGGESLHGWLRVDCPDAETWTREIEQDLFPRLLEPMGADRACKNDARLSRTPGAKRGDRWQRLLYLNPDAGRGAA